MPVQHYDILFKIFESTYDRYQISVVLESEIIAMFPALVEELQLKLSFYGITCFDEVALRQELELRAPTYTLIKLADWPARRWKCRYRLMMGDGMHDAQSVPEAYALALLAVMSQPSNAPVTGANNDPS